jgi:hypothetical protein
VSQIESARSWRALIRFNGLLEGAPVFGGLQCWCWRMVRGMRDCGLEGGGKEFFVDWRS